MSWNTTQTITLQAIDDYLIDGSHETKFETIASIQLHCW